MATYRIARRLTASAGLLDAYIGVETETQQPVVVKRLMSPWQAEALTLGHTFRASGALERPVQAVPDWREVGFGRGTVWLTHALQDGETLRGVMSQLTAQRGFITPNEGLGLVGLVAGVLVGLHERKLVHADLCPSTVLVTAEGAVWLLDAGVAACVPPSTSLGPARAEPFSLAPEQFNEAPTTATDVFRLGLMVYELAVGHALFSAADPGVSMVQCQRYLGLERDRIKSVPEPWASLTQQMLAADPRERPSARDVSQVLNAAAAKAGWKSARGDAARLVARAFPTRVSLVELAAGGTQELVLGPLPPLPPPKPRPVEPPDEERPNATTGTFSTLPGIAEPPPPALPPPSPAAAPSVGPATTPGAVVGRITTKKMTRSELEAERAADAPATVVVAAPPPEDPLAPRDARVGELLIEKKAITRSQLDEARAQVSNYGGTLADALIAIGAVDEDTLVTTLADVTRTPHTTSKKLGEMQPPADAMAKVPLEVARSLDLVPLGLKGGSQLMVAMKDPMDSGALEKLKTATGFRNVVAVRAGENAIRRTRNRFYLGEIDERPDWLEGSSRGAPVVPALRPVRPDEEELPMVQGSISKLLQVGPSEPPPLTPGVPAAVSLDSPAGRMVTALLSLAGDRGNQAVVLADLCASVASKLGLAKDEVERARFAAMAVCVANLVEGRPVFDVPSIGSLSAVLGEQGWNLLEPLLAAWLDWPSAIPAEAGPRAVCVSFAFALHSGLPLPKGSALGGALNSFKTRFKVEPAVLELLVRGLASA